MDSLSNLLMYSGHIPPSWTSTYRIFKVTFEQLKLLHGNNKGIVTSKCESGTNFVNHMVMEPLGLVV